METKGELRQHYRLLRQQLSPAELESRSQAVARRFFDSLPLDQISVLHTYLPIDRHRELSPWPIITRLRQEYPHIRLVLSRTLWEQRQMEHVFWDEGLVVQENEWGIPEPVEGVICEAEQIDAVLVPLLAFDRQGHRLGYGAGFYDRFLASCSSQVLGIGLSLFPPLEEALPGIFPTDIPLTHCLTPEMSFVFNG
jgi:5-formyltetrahydrofolate cyclo-ligase